MHSLATGAADLAEGDRPATFDMAQAVRMLTGVFLIAWGYAWFVESERTAVAPLVSLLALAAGLVTMGVAACDHSPGFWHGFDTLVFAAVLAFAIPWFAVRAGEFAYGTDEVAIGQLSANAVLNGVNPYHQDLLPLLPHFNLSPHIETPLLGGGNVHKLSYPALSFLVYVPAAAVLGQGAPHAQTVDAVAWAVTLALLWKLLPRRVRPIVPVIGSISFYVELVASGTTDSLFLPLLCLALWRWHRFGVAEERSAARWIGPVALGLACAVKQTPWLVAPFLVAGIALEARHCGVPWRSRAARYAGITALAFLAPNLPFILLDPTAWLHGVLLPLADPLIPFGQGLVQVIGGSGLGGGRLYLFTAASLAGEITALLALVALYPRSRALLPLLAVAPLALGTRSLSGYFVDALPPLLVASATVPWVPAPTTAPSWRARLRRPAAVGACAAGIAAAALATVAVASPPPLSVVVLSADTVDRGLGPGTRLVVSLRNTAATVDVYPSFVTRVRGDWVSGWRTVAGPASLPPGGVGTYTIVSTSPGSVISRGDVFSVAALLPAPASVSVSASAVLR